MTAFADHAAARLSAIDPTTQQNLAILEELITRPGFMRWFIMCALEEYCETVKKAGVAGLDNPLVDPKDWIECANATEEAMSRWRL